MEGWAENARLERGHADVSLFLYLVNFTDYVAINPRVLVCLCVCVSVCLCACVISTAQTNGPIFN